MDVDKNLLEVGLIGEGEGGVGRLVFLELF
jgi:hypothetical protein